MTRRQIRGIIRHACKRCECPELLERGRIKLEFTDKLTSSLADAEWVGTKAEGFGVIRLSIKEWEGLNHSQRTELVIHETAHIICDFKYGRYKDAANPHGARWKLLAKACGLENPTACVEV